MQLKRKLQGRTDYKKRLEMIKSAKPRLVVRRSLKSLFAQIIEYHPDGDKVILSAHTNELRKKYNWNAKRNTPTAYLLGLLIGQKSKQKKIKECILDLGLYAPIKGSIIFAVLKGAVDAGLNIPHSKDVFPKEDRLQGKHTKYKPEDIKNFESIKSRLIKGE